MTEPKPLDKRRMAQIYEAVAAGFEVDAKALAGTCRSRDLVWPRHVAWFIAYRECQHVVQVALAARRDHTSILHGLQAAKARAREYPGMRAKIGRIEAELSRDPLAEPTTFAVTVLERVRTELPHAPGALLRDVYCAIVGLRREADLQSVLGADICD